MNYLYYLMTYLCCCWIVCKNIDCAPNKQFILLVQHKTDKPFLIEAIARRLTLCEKLIKVQPILTAKVPIIKFTVKMTGLEGDISLDNILVGFTICVYSWYFSAKVLLLFLQSLSGSLWRERPFLFHFHQPGFSFLFFLS